MRLPSLLLAIPLAVGCSAPDENDSEESGSAVILGGRFTSPLEPGWYRTDDHGFLLFISNDADAQFVKLEGRVTAEGFRGIADVDLAKKVVRVSSVGCNGIELRASGTDVVLDGTCTQVRKNVFASTVLHKLDPSTVKGRFVGTSPSGEQVAVDLTNVTPKEAKVRISIGNTTNSYSAESSGLNFNIENACATVTLLIGGGTRPHISLLENRLVSKDCPAIVESLRPANNMLIPLARASGQSWDE